MKVDNSKMEPISRLVKGVNIQIRDWIGSTNIMQLHLDDFYVVFRLEFL